MRLLYVAATRAENKLIFTANISKACDEYMSLLDVNRAGKRSESVTEAVIFRGLSRHCQPSAIR